MTMDERNAVSELELMAYADGVLDDDPRRKASIEERLRASAADAARVAAYRAQNEALRRHYDPTLAEAVPAHLLKVLERPARRPAWFNAKLTATAAAIALVGLAGWAVGQRGDPGEWSPREFVQQSYDNYLGARSEADSGSVPQTATVNALQWLSQRISLSLKVPDLSGDGYALVDRQTVSTGDNQLVRLTYRARDGRSFDLILQPRWEASDPGVHVAQRDEISLAYWFDGPLAHAVVSRVPTDEARRLAVAVRRAMHDPDASEPAVELTPRLGSGFGVAGTDPSSRQPHRPAADGARDAATDPGRRSTVTN
jgi:anti-sigma factor RsiW